MTLPELLNQLPAEIGSYALTITRYFDPELEQLLWSFSYENAKTGTILDGCDINASDFELGARELYDWLRDWLRGHRHITENDKNALEVDNLIDSITL